MFPLEWEVSALGCKISLVTAAGTTQLRTIGVSDGISGHDANPLNPGKTRSP